MSTALSRFSLCVALVGVALPWGDGRTQAAGEKEPAEKPGAAGALKVQNEAGKEVSLSPEALAKLPRQSAKVKDHRGNAATYEGVVLAEVLKTGGVKLGKD